MLSHHDQPGSEVRPAHKACPRSLAYTGSTGPCIMTFSTALMTHLPATVVREELHTPAAFLVQQRHHLDGVSTRILQHCAQACQGVTTVDDVLHLYIQQFKTQKKFNTSATTCPQDLHVIVGGSADRRAKVWTWDPHTAAADDELGEDDTGLPWPCLPCRSARVVQSCMEPVLSTVCGTGGSPAGCCIAPTWTGHRPP